MESKEDGPIGNAGKLELRSVTEACFAEVKDRQCTQSPWCTGAVDEILGEAVSWPDEQTGRLGGTGWLRR